MMSMTISTSRAHLETITPAATSTTSCITVSVKFTQKPTIEMETSKHKTPNNTLVNMNEVLNRIWKLSRDHTPFVHKTETHQDKQIILYEGLKLEH